MEGMKWKGGNTNSRVEVRVRSRGGEKATSGEQAELNTARRGRERRAETGKEQINN